MTPLLLIVPLDHSIFMQFSHPSACAAVSRIPIERCLRTLNFPISLCWPTGPSITEIWMDLCPIGFMSYWVFCEGPLLVVRTHYWFWTGARHSCLCGGVTEQPSTVSACVEACAAFTCHPETLDNSYRSRKMQINEGLKKSIFEVKFLLRVKR